MKKDKLKVLIADGHSIKAPQDKTVEGVKKCSPHNVT